MVWKNSHLPKAIMRGHWDAIACTASVAAKIKESLNVVPDGKESECDVHFSLSETRKNPNVEFNETFWLTAACRSAHLEGSFRALFAGLKVVNLARQVTRFERSEENVFMSHALYSPLDIGLGGKVSRGFEARLFRAVSDGLKVVRTARLFQSGCFRFPNCAEAGRKREVSFVRVFSRPDIWSTGPDGLHLKRLLKFDDCPLEDGDTFTDRKSVSLSSLAAKVLVRSIAKGIVDLIKATGPGEGCMVMSFLKICAVSRGQWEDQRHLLMFNSGKDDGKFLQEFCDCSRCAKEIVEAFFRPKAMSLVMVSVTNFGLKLAERREPISWRMTAR
jgi:hypothetical protein